MSNLKSTLNKFAPRRADLEPAMESFTADDLDSAGMIGNIQDQAGISRLKGNGFGLHDDLLGDPVDREDQLYDTKRESGVSPETSMTRGRGRRSRPLRAAPFNRVASPGGNTSFLDATGSSPSRASSPVNVSSNSLTPGNELGVTPSSSRPTSRHSSRSNSRPTSRPSSRVSNGRYHSSRNLSPDSLNSFNVMMDKEDLDEDDLHRAGHMSLIVSDPEHLKILEGEIEDPFSPSMSVIDPDALSSLMQSAAPFGIKSTSPRGQSPAYRSRRQRQADAGDESFLEEDALSDKELNPKVRTSRTGTRTPSSPLARAVTRASPRPHTEGVFLSANSGVQLSLDQVLSGGLNGQQGDKGTVLSVPVLQHPDQQNDAQSKVLSGNPDPSNNSDKVEGDVSQSKDDHTGSSHAKVDIVVQDVNDEARVGAGNPNIKDNAPSGQGFQFQDSSEVQARSFAEWMSSSSEISKLDINTPSVPHMSGTDSTLGTTFLSSKPGDPSVLTSSYTPGSTSPSETTSVSPISATSPSATKRSTLLEKRTNLMEDILARARGARQQAAENGQKSLEQPSAESVPEAAGTTTSTGPSGSDEAMAVAPEESESTKDGETLPLSLAARLEKKELLKRPSTLMLSSRIRDSTNLDAPRYSIREMEDMKMKVRMELRIEITNEIKEEYERSADQDASIYQAEIEELKATLEKETKEKEQLKGVLDEYVSSIDEIAVSTGGEIQILKEQNAKLTESQEETQEAFVLLKTRYDELKDLNHKHVENAEILRKAIEVLKQDYETSESRYDSLKSHADSRMSQASQEMEQTRILYDNEVAMLKSQYVRQEHQMRTLEQALEIKTKEYEQLMQFSEDMIAKLQ